MPTTIEPRKSWRGRCMALQRFFASPVRLCATVRVPDTGYTFHIQQEISKTSEVIRGYAIYLPDGTFERGAIQLSPSTLTDWFGVLELVGCRDPFTSGDHAVYV